MICWRGTRGHLLRYDDVGGVLGGTYSDMMMLEGY